MEAMRIGGAGQGSTWVAGGVLAVAMLAAGIYAAAASGARSLGESFRLEASTHHAASVEFDTRAARTSPGPHQVRAGCDYLPTGIACRAGSPPR